MSIYVKGHYVPDNCHLCVAGYGGFCYFCPPDDDGLCPDEGRAGWCPMTNVPDHGRLVDADGFDERVRLAGGMADEELSDDFKDGVQTVLLMLKTQKTIIPADKEAKP